MYPGLSGASDVSFGRHGCMQMHSKGQVAWRRTLKPACHDSQFSINSYNVDLQCCL